MPAEHVNKLFRMLQDIELNEDLNKQFQAHVKGQNSNLGGGLGREGEREREREREREKERERDKERERE